jgi:putative ABC transport system permease protein
LIESDPVYQYYLPLAQRPDGRPNGLIVRVRGDMAPVLPAVQREILAIDPRVRFVRTRPLPEVVAPKLRQWRLGATLFGAFGLLALIVAAVGLYALLASYVAQRAS